MYEALFQPLTMGTLELPNRIVRGAHGTRLLGEEFVRYHEERARGGVGLSILQNGGVHPSSPTPTLPIHDDGILPLYNELATRVRPYGMKVIQQLWHGGSAFSSGLPGTETWSSSPVPHPRIGVIPIPMTKLMIDEVVEAFGLGARRAREGGLDGVEIHGAHSYLVGQFLSPALNHREDAYGGSDENRLRFLREVIASIRSHAGADFTLGVRFSATDLIEGGLSTSDTARIAGAIEGEVDFVDLSYGGHWHYNAMFKTMESPLGYEIGSSEVVTRTLTKPTIVTGRIMTLDHAEQLVTSGVADAVSMVRALIADPYLVAKARDGRAAEVRPCISANTGCLGGIKAGRIGCVVNPSAGHEGAIPFEPPPAPIKKRVLVIGGGPAGMEAARTAALRGHEVHLHEMLRQLGGQCRFASSVEERADQVAIVSWQESELVRLGVTITRNSFADLDTVTALDPDEVIVATGSRPEVANPQALRPSGAIPGSDLPHVVTSWDALGFGGSLGTTGAVVIFDDTGTFEAITVALKAVREASRVTVVTRQDSLGAQVPYPLGTVHPVLERLQSAGVVFVPSSMIVEIGEREVVVSGVGAEDRRPIEADAVVLVSYRTSNREVGEQLRDAGIHFHQIGDANGTAELQRAIHDGAAIGRAI